MEHALHEFDIICTNGKLIIFEKKDMRNLITLTLLSANSNVHTY